jgi:hypothetical protein
MQVYMTRATQNLRRIALRPSQTSSSYPSFSKSSSVYQFLQALTTKLPSTDSISLVAL